MFIQDLANHALNVTAEIPEAEATAFHMYCLRYYNELNNGKSVAVTLDTGSSSPPTTAAMGQTEVSQDDQNIRKSNIDDDDSLESKILIETADLLTRLPSRIQSEASIFLLLKSLVGKFDPLLKLVPIGSTVYGLGGTHTNFNLLVNAGGYSALFTLVTFSINSNILCLQSSRHSIIRIMRSMSCVCF